MPELDAVAAVQTPSTVQSLLAALRALGIRRGDTVIVHSAMSKIGWVCGREMAVVRALLLAVGHTGLLVMPAHSGDNSEPSDWCNPAVPESWHALIRAQMPAYDRRNTPTRCMGRIAECFRTWPCTHRSAHPHVSWCAHGFGARWMLRGHTVARPCFGMRSPLGRMYRRNVKILLLGVGYGNCTALHLAETLYPSSPKMELGAAVRVRGHRQWARWQDVDFDSDRFVQIGEAYEAQGGAVTLGKLGAADCKVLHVRPLVDFGLRWLAAQGDALQTAEG